MVYDSMPSSSHSHRGLFRHFNALRSSVCMFSGLVDTPNMGEASSEMLLDLLVYDFRNTSREGCSGIN